MAVTPMMKQYFEIKDQYRDYILFYRLGDFYEMFFEDAQLASRELELTLTGRDCGEGQRAPMCGVPYHSCEPYIGKLIEKGYKVAICEQTEDPATAKNIVRREVIRVITPGTVIESDGTFDVSNYYTSREGSTSHVDHANVLYQIPEDATGLPMVFLHGYGQSRMG